jgi:hypothetical protein
MSIKDGGRPSTAKGQPQKPTPPSRFVQYARQRDSNAESLFSPEELAAMRENARLRVENEIKKRAEDQLLSRYMDEERQALIPEEEICEIFLNLAPHSTYIMLDGKQYWHEHVYLVRRAVFQVLSEQMNRGWAHDDQTQVSDSRGRRRHRPPMGIGYDNFAGRVGPWGADRNLVVGAAELAGAAPSRFMGYTGPVEGLQSA